VFFEFSWRLVAIGSGLPWTVRLLLVIVSALDCRK